MKYNETLNYIHSLKKFSSRPTLDRMTEACKRLNNPQNGFKTIHIAGTNGKGSVCAFVSSALVAAGYRVGMFVSPFIVDFCERIQINGKYISRNDLCRLSKIVADTGVELNEFEFITAVGFLFFCENNIDVAVIETGLGGKYDATNVITDPNLSVITKIGLDHTAILGNTLSEIAEEKCGIIKNSNAVTSCEQPDEALNVIKSHASGVIIPQKSLLTKVKTDILGNSFVYKGVPYHTSLGGEYQIENALTAIEALENCKIELSAKHIIKGLETAFMPARLEVTGQNPLTVIDGAHNPDGARELAKALKEYSNITAIIGVMRDKNYKRVLAETLPLCKNVICTEPQVNRSLSVAELATEAQKYCQNVFKADTVENALKYARLNFGDNPLFVFGSLYLASEIRPLLKDFKI